MTAEEKNTRSAPDDKTMKSALFIVNPHSGTNGKSNIPELLDRHLDDSLFKKQVIFTRYAGEARELSHAGKDKYDLIVAVGGDGTINEVAHPLLHSDAVLGIIPCGSGNGLARHLGIPTDPVKAIHLLNRLHVCTIDSLKLDDDVFLNVAGVGFDAYVARSFAKSKRRGFMSYAITAFHDIRTYKADDYDLVIDGEEVSEDSPFLIAVANSSQFGNNAYIAPKADISDGLMDVCVLRKFPAWYVPALIYRLFTGNLTESTYYHCWQAKEVKISVRDDSRVMYIHLDGDPYSSKNNITFSVNPLSLKVACGKDDDKKQ